MNLVCVEKHYTFEYKGKMYKARTIDDYEYGEFDTLITDDSGNVLPKSKEKVILAYFLKHKDEA